MKERAHCSVVVKEHVGRAAVGSLSSMVMTNACAVLALREEWGFRRSQSVA